MNPHRGPLGRGVCLAPSNFISLVDWMAVVLNHARKHSYGLSGTDGPWPSVCIPAARGFCGSKGPPFPPSGRDLATTKGSLGR